METVLLLATRARVLVCAMLVTLVQTARQLCPALWILWTTHRTAPTGSCTANTELSQGITLTAGASASMILAERTATSASQQPRVVRTELPLRILLALAPACAHQTQTDFSNGLAELVEIM